MGDAKAQAPKVMMAETIEMLAQRATLFDNPFLESAAFSGEIFGLSVLAITDTPLLNVST
jgi:hypothetical protein